MVSSLDPFLHMTTPEVVASRYTATLPTQPTTMTPLNPLTPLYERSIQPENGPWPNTVPVEPMSVNRAVVQPLDAPKERLMERLDPRIQEYLNTRERVTTEVLTELDHIRLATRMDEFKQAYPTTFEWTVGTGYSPGLAYALAPGGSIVSTIEKLGNVLETTRWISSAVNFMAASEETGTTGKQTIHTINDAVQTNLHLRTIENAVGASGLSDAIDRTIGWSHFETAMTATGFHPFKPRTDLIPDLALGGKVSKVFMQSVDAIEDYGMKGVHYLSSVVDSSIRDFAHTVAHAASVQDEGYASLAARFPRTGAGTRYFPTQTI